MFGAIPQPDNSATPTDAVKAVVSPIAIGKSGSVHVFQDLVYLTLII